MLALTRSRLLVVMATTAALVLAAVGLVPASASSPTARPARPRTQAISATLQGTSTIDEGGSFLTDVSTGTIAGRPRDTARLVSYRFNRDVNEPGGTDLSSNGSVTLQRPRGATVTGTIFVPLGINSGTFTVDGTIIVEGGTKHFRHATGTLTVLLSRVPEAVPLPPVHTTDSGTISGTLTY
jgi:hypothetical protein